MTHGKKKDNSTANDLCATGDYQNSAYVMRCLLLEAYENGVISANKIKLFREKLDLERLRLRHSVQNIDECKQ